MVMNKEKYGNQDEILLEKLEETEIPMNFRATDKKTHKKDINVLSLFSGCGGMDLGLEGGFTVHKDSISEKYNPDFIDNKVDEYFVRLKPTRFKIAFANDILKEAKTAWIHNFEKLGYDSNIFHSGSMVDLVKMHKMGVDIFHAQFKF